MCRHSSLTYTIHRTHTRKHTRTYAQTHRHTPHIGPSGGLRFDTAGSTGQGRSVRVLLDRRCGRV